MQDKIVRLTGKTLKAKKKLRSVAAMEFAKRITSRQLELVWMVVQCQHQVPFSVENGPWLFVQPLVHCDELTDQLSDSFVAESELSSRWVHANQDRDFTIEFLDASPYVGGCDHVYKYRNLPSSISTTLWYVEGRDALGGSGVLEWCYHESDAKDRLSIMSAFPQFTALAIGEFDGGPGMNRLVAEDLKLAN